MRPVVDDDGGVGRKGVAAAAARGGAVVKQLLEDLGGMDISKVDGLVRGVDIGRAVADNLFVPANGRGPESHAGEDGNRKNGREGVHCGWPTTGWAVGDLGRVGDEDVEELDVVYGSADVEEFHLTRESAA